MKEVITCLFLLSFVINTAAQTYTINENGTYEDILTPEYYTSANGSAFRNSLNKLIFFARQDSFQHPLQNSLGQTPSSSTPINGMFGAGKGPGGTGQHHKAKDMHVGNKDSNVTVFAAQSGAIKTFTNVPKYRDYITITRDIKDSSNTVLGKMVTVYAHLNLAIDLADGLNLNGKYVTQGDTISNHLYSGTAGGPHLHFEIRYYKTTDIGDEEFYGIAGPNLTTLSTGSWQYGKWNPAIGYGFANPENHLNKAPLKITKYDFKNKLSIFPNPANNYFSIKVDAEKDEKFDLAILNTLGQPILKKKFQNEMKISTEGVAAGTYFLKLSTNNKVIIRKININKN